MGVLGAVAAVPAGSWVRQADWAPWRSPRSLWTARGLASRHRGGMDGPVEAVGAARIGSEPRDVCLLGLRHHIDRHSYF